MRKKTRLCSEPGCSAEGVHRGVHYVGTAKLPEYRCERHKAAKATTLTVPTDLREALSKAASIEGLCGATSWAEYARMILWRHVRIDVRTAKGAPRG